MSRLGNKEFDYFENFLQCSEMASKAANYLYRSLSAFDPQLIETQVAEMHRIENDADMQKHEMLKKLAHEFMTPIEREDIVTLSQKLDDVVDAIEDVMGRVYIFNIKKIRPEVITFMELILKGCNALTTAVREFRNFKKSKTIHSFIIEVNSIESEGDKLYMEYMRKLFVEDNDMRERIVWMTMFECLEHCLDACEDAADIIESVIMKNT